jgi:hypothetical protein
VKWLFKNANQKKRRESVFCKQAFHFTSLYFPYFLLSIYVFF